MVREENAPGLRAVLLILAEGRTGSIRSLIGLQSTA